MRIAIFDYETIATNPSGRSHLAVLRDLCEEHDFTVFSVRFDNPRPDRIRWVRVPAVRRPLLALLLTYHPLSLVLYLVEVLRTRRRFDLVQAADSGIVPTGVVHAQFCHRAYLRDHWRSSRPQGVRRPVRFLFEWVAALLEPVTYRRAGTVVVPSKGLAQELTDTYPSTVGKVTVVPLAVQVQVSPPVGFDAAALRAAHGIPADALLLAFVALGHYERKGLPVLLDALHLVPDDTHVLVVGGEPDLIARYRRRCEDEGLGARVHFVGNQRQVHPFLWASDAFVFPSAYETFSYATMEAAALGLPIVVTRLHGVSDVLRHGHNGFLIERDAASVAAAITELHRLGPEGRRALGANARADVSHLTEERHVRGWAAVYERLAP